jgi:hypothetical protein
MVQRFKLSNQSGLVGSLGSLFMVFAPRENAVVNVRTTYHAVDRAGKQSPWDLIYRYVPTVLESSLLLDLPVRRLLVVVLES